MASESSNIKALKTVTEKAKGFVKTEPGKRALAKLEKRIDQINPNESKVGTIPKQFEKGGLIV